MSESQKQDGWTTVGKKNKKRKAKDSSLNINPSKKLLVNEGCEENPMEFSVPLRESTAINENFETSADNIEVVENSEHNEFEEEIKSLKKTVETQKKTIEFLRLLVRTKQDLLQDDDDHE